MAALIADFKKRKVEKMESAASRATYTKFLDRLDAMAGDCRVDALTRRDIYALQDQMSDTPPAANLMIAVLRTVLEFGVKRPPLRWHHGRRYRRGVRHVGEDGVSLFALR